MFDALGDARTDTINVNFADWITGRRCKSADRRWFRPRPAPAGSYRSDRRRVVGWRDRRRPAHSAQAIEIRVSE
jgi:hypothetical protein